MLLKAAASILFFLVIFNGFSSAALAMNSLDQEVSDSLLKKDWPNLVLVLKPHEGQNFEHDLTLAKAYLSLERRAEAIALLKKLNEPGGRHDDRARSLFELSLTQFFSQDTSTLYFEAVKFISQQRWAEARERLDQAASKEPGQGWILLRQIQVHLALNAKAALEDDFKLASEEALPFPEFKIYSAKLMLMNIKAAPVEIAPLPEVKVPFRLDVKKIEAEKLEAKTDEEDIQAENAASALKTLANAKDVTSKYELPFTWYLEALSRNDHQTELNGLASRLLKDHSQWSSAIYWFVQRNKNAEKDSSSALSEKQIADFLAQLKLNLKDRSEYELRLESEAKSTQYYYLNPQSYDLIHGILLKDVK
jgi:hypothetical protein